MVCKFMVVSRHGVLSAHAFLRRDGPAGHAERNAESGRHAGLECQSLACAPHKSCCPHRSRQGGEFTPQKQRCVCSHQLCRRTNPCSTGLFHFLVWHVFSLCFPRSLVGHEIFRIRAGMVDPSIWERGEYLYPSNCPALNSDFQEMSCTFQTCLVTITGPASGERLEWVAAPWGLAGFLWALCWGRTLS